MAKVVLCIDGSTHADDAYKWYVKNFHKPDNEVLLLHIPENYVNAASMTPGTVLECKRKADLLSAQLKEKFSQLAKSDNLNAEWFCESSAENKPGQAICDFAKAHNASFIVTGTRGMGTVRRTLLGSVSDYVVHHSHVPVLVCRQK